MEAGRLLIVDYSVFSLSSTIRERYFRSELYHNDLRKDWENVGHYLENSITKISSEIPSAGEPVHD